MPKLIVPLIGAGTETDPYRVDLPTFNMLAVDYANAQAIVELPAEDLPPALSSERPTKVTLNGKPVDAVQLQPRHEAELRAHLAQRYEVSDGIAK